MASKLHIPGPGAGPLCGRQLNNHRSEGSQVSDRAVLAPTYEAFLTGLNEGKACRHCARAAGLLPRLVRGPRFEGDEAEDGEQADE